MAESADVEQFAQQNPQINVIGVGGLDSYALAENFLSRTGVQNFPLVYDDSFGAWNDLGVSSQHTVVVFDENGARLDNWRGFDGPRILETVG